MKKQLKMLFILLTIAFSVFNFANRTLFTFVNATYVEGPITQDTIWTRVDSPFVVSKNVTVYSNATLTIESGVEVKFGGYFSLIISGILYANGTEKTITFTSNKEQPEVGDWKAITFNGMGKSVLIGCFVAYAEDGISVENGNVELENSTISLCQNGITVANSKLIIENSSVSLCRQNGINITNSESIVQNSLIAENQENGICITGNAQVTIQKNTIMANGNGICLTGNEASNVNISQNKISANKQSGIKIDANNHTNITIVNNIVSSNTEGFYVSSPISMYITNNSISYNKIGILYDQGDHTASYNDIYGNEMGMDVLLNATVNAEHNYWGDKSGPYHVLLNPNGQGNPVGGNGVNLHDFIFFLTKPIGIINTRPTATLLTDKIWVRPNEDVMFFATNSFDSDGRVDRYFFNFGDGKNSGWTTLSIVTHKYSSNGTYYANLTVMDDYGATSNSVNATIYVENLPSLRVRVDLSNSTIHEGEQVPITVYVTTGTTAVENATITMFSVKDGNFTESSGLTNASGYFVTTFTAPEITEKVNVRIVARASKIEYADGSNYEYLEILPSLSVQITANPDVIKSEETAQISIHVKSNGESVANASVTILSSSGSLSSETAMTNSSGTVSLIFTAPQVNEQSNIVITARATKAGYAEAQNQLEILVNPRTFNVQISVPTVKSEESANVIVHVTCKEDATPVADAMVTMSSSDGNFSVITKTTNSTGICTFIFNAPQTTAQLSITITANVTRNGYIDGGNQTAITVNPKTAPQAEGGWPITTILLIIIPIIIAVVVVILIKLKIIVLSTGEEE